MEIRNLEGISFDTIFDAFRRAFSDYEINFGKEEIRSMLRRRGFTPELSFAAFEGDEIIAFTLNGTGLHKGIPTAYDTGTGTAPEYRGKGIAKEIFLHSILLLKQAGIEQYLLEVLQNNTKALSVYRGLGFRIVRDFACYRQELDKITLPRSPQRIEGLNIRPLGIDELSTAPDFLDYPPSWQNNDESIRRAGSDLRHIGAFLEGKLAGYCVFDPATGDITRIAVAPTLRRRCIASLMLAEALTQFKAPAVKILNVSPNDNTLRAFLHTHNIHPAASQHEMLRNL